MNHFGYDEFHKMCLDIRTKNRTLITRRNCSYIVCCKNFLRDCVQIEGVEKLIKRLKGRCLFFFYDYDDNVCCSQRINDFSKVDYYCFSCQYTVLLEFSKKLHVFFSSIDFS